MYLFIIGGFSLGFTLVLLMLYIVRSAAIKEAQTDANDLIQNAKTFSKETMEALQEQIEDLHFQEEKKVAPAMNQLQKKIAKRTNQLEDIAANYEGLLQKVKEGTRGLQSNVDKKKHRVNIQSQAFKSLKQQHIKPKEELLKRLKEALPEDEDEIKGELRNNIIEETRNLALKDANFFQTEFKSSVERISKTVIDSALNRFARPYCAERGTGYVALPNDMAKEKLLGPDNSHLTHIESLCGVDLIYKEDMNSINISGFDPVRRELARNIMLSLLKKKHVTIDLITKEYRWNKDNLFKQVKRDGRKLMHELRLTDVAPPIINMMGGLKYRYSFAQNQYFHCAEVGHLCGLIASELNINTSSARRAGLLHDIGKAMDHSIDGGHAVIGADFIENMRKAPK